MTIIVPKCITDCFFPERAADPEKAAVASERKHLEGSRCSPPVLRFLCRGDQSPPSLAEPGSADGEQAPRPAKQSTRKLRKSESQIPQSVRLAMQTKRAMAKNGSGLDGSPLRGKADSDEWLSGTECSEKSLSDSKEWPHRKSWGTDASSELGKPDPRMAQLKSLRVLRAKFQGMSEGRSISDRDLFPKDFSVAHIAKASMATRLAKLKGPTLTAFERPPKKAGIREQLEKMRESGASDGFVQFQHRDSNELIQFDLKEGDRIPGIEALKKEALEHMCLPDLSEVLRGGSDEGVIQMVGDAVQAVQRKRDEITATERRAYRKVIQSRESGRNPFGSGGEHRARKIGLQYFGSELLRLKSERQINGPKNERPIAEDGLPELDGLFVECNEDVMKVCLSALHERCGGDVEKFSPDDHIFHVASTLSPALTPELARDGIAELQRQKREAQKQLAEKEGRLPPLERDENGNA
ncbi:MAG: hypothetical protein ABW032_08095 [Burkholderiaceae bacterium]